MKPLVALPESAHIVCTGELVLKIKNNKVVSEKNNFIWWLMAILKFGHWDEALPQMISQGFRYDAFLERCVAEIRDLNKFASMIWWHYPSGIFFDNLDRHIKFVSSPAGLALAVQIISKINTCRNWQEFYILMKRDSPFYLYIEKYVVGGIRI